MRLIVTSHKHESYVWLWPSVADSVSLEWSGLRCAMCDSGTGASSHDGDSSMSVCMWRTACMCVSRKEWMCVVCSWWWHTAGWLLSHGPSDLYTLWWQYYEHLWTLNLTCRRRLKATAIKEGLWLWRRRTDAAFTETWSCKSQSYHIGLVIVAFQLGPIVAIALPLLQWQCWRVFLFCYTPNEPFTAIWTAAPYPCFEPIGRRA